MKRADIFTCNCAGGGGISDDSFRPLDVAGDGGKALELAEENEHEDKSQ